MRRCHWSRPVTNSVLLFVFLWAKGLNENEIHSEMRPLYSDKCFTRPTIAYTFSVRSLLFQCRESIVDKERPGRHVVATTDATIAAVDAFVRSSIYATKCTCTSSVLCSYSKPTSYKWERNLTNVHNDKYQSQLVQIKYKNRSKTFRQS